MKKIFILPLLPLLALSSCGHRSSEPSTPAVEYVHPTDLR